MTLSRLSLLIRLGCKALMSKAIEMLGNQLECWQLFGLMFFQGRESLGDSPEGLPRHPRVEEQLEGLRDRYSPRGGGKNYYILVYYENTEQKLIGISAIWNFLFINLYLSLFIK